MNKKMPDFTTKRFFNLHFIQKYAKILCKCVKEGIFMKKFLSVILSMSILINGVSVTPVAFADTVSSNVTKDTISSNVTKEELQEKKNKWILGRMLDWGSNVGKKFKEIEEGGSSLYRIYLFATQMSKIVKRKMFRISSNIYVVTEELDQELQKIKGQDKAKKKMKEIVSSIIDARNEAIENKRPYGKGDVIYMVGPSGVGKTFSADCLARAIMGKKAKPIYIDASDIDTQSGRSIKEQLFYLRDGQKRGSISFCGILEDTSLVGQIKTNPNIVLIINEYDKMHSKDFDEVLRTIVDRGQISVYDEKIDCSGLLVIVTSNEDHFSVTLGNNDDQFKDDGTGSRTRVHHDKSFLNRLNLVEFDNLDKEAYELITENKLIEIEKRYKEKYGIKFNFIDITSKIADKAVETNQGAREIEKIIARLKSAIMKTRINNSNNANFNNETYNVYYENDEFRLELVPSMQYDTLKTSDNKQNGENKSTKIASEKKESNKNISNVNELKLESHQTELSKIETPNVDDYKVKMDMPDKTYDDKAKNDYVLKNNKISLEFDNSQENNTKVS